MSANITFFDVSNSPHHFYHISHYITYPFAISISMTSDRFSFHYISQVRGRIWKTHCGLIFSLTSGSCMINPFVANHSSVSATPNINKLCLFVYHISLVVFSLLKVPTSSIKEKRLFGVSSVVLVEMYRSMMVKVDDSVVAVSMYRRCRILRWGEGRRDGWTCRECSCSSHHSMWRLVGNVLATENFGNPSKEFCSSECKRSTWGKYDYF